MKKVFKEHISVQALVYLENIIIYSPSKEQHRHNMQAVLETLKKNHLYAKPSKFTFFVKEIAFLGHIVSF